MKLAAQITSASSIVKAQNAAMRDIGGLTTVRSDQRPFALHFPAAGATGLVPFDNTFSYGPAVTDGIGILCDAFKISNPSDYMGPTVGPPALGRQLLSQSTLRSTLEGSLRNADWFTQMIPPESRDSNLPLSMVCGFNALASQFVDGSVVTATGATKAAGTVLDLASKILRSTHPHFASGIQWAALGFRGVSEVILLRRIGRSVLACKPDSP
jgi:hypothetical protein